MNEFEKKNKPVYYDPHQNKFYWIEWIETGNNDIPIRHYLAISLWDAIAAKFGKFKNTVIRETHKVRDI